MYLHFRWWEVILLVLVAIPFLPAYLYDYIKERRERNTD